MTDIIQSYGSNNRILIEHLHAHQPGSCTPRRAPANGLDRMPSHLRFVHAEVHGVLQIHLEHGWNVNASRPIV